MAITQIGSTLVIEGEISGSDAVVVQGRVKGSIETSQGVVIENSAHVEANLTLDTLEVAGDVKGNVTAASRVEIKPEGKMVGDIKAPRILIADGAHFKGNIDMDVGR